MTNKLDFLYRRREQLEEKLFQPWVKIDKYLWMKSEEQLLRELIDQELNNIKNNKGEKNV